MIPFLATVGYFTALLAVVLAIRAGGRCKALARRVDRIERDVSRLRRKSLS